MLVLARQRDQTIIIGDDIEVTVVDVRGDKVRLGINAPRTVSVHRKEVYEAIRRENREAAQVMPGDIPVLGIGGSGGIGRVASPLPVGTQSIESPPPRPPESVPADIAAAHRPFLQAALEEARLGLSEGGLPIGSVLVRDGRIIARGHNRRVQRGDPMAHAEIDCLTNAGRQRTYRDTILYSTLMPCFLCSGATIQFQIPKVIAGESVNFQGAPGLLRKQGIDVLDLHDAECIRLMADFIREHSDLWNEDIGR